MKPSLLFLVVLFIIGCTPETGESLDIPLTELQPGSLDHRTCEYNEFEGEVYSFCTTDYGLNSVVCLDDGVCYSHCCIVNQ